ncbi:hypothetical protein NHX12_031619 [Muraenolepis orangiensis]|uniref:Uncharacterized protein n=1 Tax=Muraenolepis orangiensis TaxID=630683 RepID=A0A9Q0IJV0_9TELE|nr:hypothetical protein NHX12_031619 [Muraenolepis orangiensis]
MTLNRAWDGPFYKQQAAMATNDNEMPPIPGLLNSNGTSNESKTKRALVSARLPELLYCCDLVSDRYLVSDGDLVSDRYLVSDR